MGTSSFLLIRYMTTGILVKHYFQANNLETSRRDPEENLKKTGDIRGGEFEGAE